MSESDRWTHADDERSRRRLQDLLGVRSADSATVKERQQFPQVFADLPGERPIDFLYEAHTEDRWHLRNAAAQLALALAHADKPKIPMISERLIQTGNGEAAFLSAQEGKFFGPALFVVESLMEAIRVQHEDSLRGLDG